MSGDHRDFDDADQPWRWALERVAASASGPPLDPSLRITVHFHPDRVSGRRLLIERLAHEGIYRSQFETATSNGGLSAHPGGDRWRWESRLFAGAYDDAPAHARPKYGSLHDRALPAGGSVRSAPRICAWLPTSWSAAHSATPTASSSPLTWAPRRPCRC